METLEGQAAEDFHDLRMEIGDTVLRARVGDSLGVELADGRVVPMHLASARLVPNTDAEGSFDELLEQGLAEAFLEWAPGEGETIRIRGFAVRTGDALAMRGIAERAATPGDGYREAGAEVQSMEVELMAAGADALARLEPTPELTPDRPAPRPAATPLPAAKPAPTPHPPGLGLPLGLLTVGASLALAGIGLAGIGGALEARPVALLLAGLLALVFGTLALRRRRFLPDLRSLTEEREGLGKRTSLGKIHATVFLVASLGAVALTSLVWTDFPNPAQLVLALGGLVALVATGTAIALALRERRSLGRLRQVASAPTRLEENRWTALDGRVTAGRYARVREHEMERDRYEDREGRTQNRVWYHYRDTVEADTLEVELASGGRLTVALGGAWIAGGRIDEVGDRLTESIEPGDAVRVVGRPSSDGEGWRVASTGEGSLLVVGAPGATAAAGRAIALHGLALLALATIAVVAGALAVLAIA